MLAQIETWKQNNYVSPNRCDYSIDLRFQVIFCLFPYLKRMPLQVLGNKGEQLVPLSRSSKKIFCVNYQMHYNKKRECVSLSIVKHE